MVKRLFLRAFPKYVVVRYHIVSIEVCKTLHGFLGLHFYNIVLDQPFIKASHSLSCVACCK